MYIGMYKHISLLNICKIPSSNCTKNMTPTYNIKNFCREISLIFSQILVLDPSQANIQTTVTYLILIFQNLMLGYGFSELEANKKWVPNF